MLPAGNFSVLGPESRMMSNKQKFGAAAKLRYLIFLLLLVVAMFVVPALIPRAHAAIPVIVLVPVSSSGL